MKKLKIALPFALAMIVVAGLLIILKPISTAPVDGDSDYDTVQPDEIMREIEFAKNAISLRSEGLVSLYNLKHYSLIEEKELLEEGEVFGNGATFREIKNFSRDSVVALNESSGALFVIKASFDGLEVMNPIKIQNPQDLASVWVGEDNIYLSYKNSKKINKADLYLSLNNQTTESFELKGNVDAFFVEDNVIYYTYENQLAKYDTVSKTGKNVLAGDRSYDLFSANHKLYVINNFGEGLNNSILLEADMDSLEVNSLVELKGLDSKIISINNDGTRMYINQKDNEYNLKSIDLENSKPLKAYKLPSADFIGLDDFIYYNFEGKTIVYSPLEDQELTRVEKINDLIAVL